MAATSIKRSRSQTLDQASRIHDRLRTISSSINRKIVAIPRLVSKCDAQARTAQRLTRVGHGYLVDTQRLSFPKYLFYRGLERGFQAPKQPLRHCGTQTSMGTLFLRKPTQADRGSKLHYSLCGNCGRPLQIDISHWISSQLLQREIPAAYGPGRGIIRFHRYLQRPRAARQRPMTSSMLPTGGRLHQ